MTNTHTKTEMEDWERVGNRMKQMKRDILDLESMLSDVPEDTYKDDLDEIDSALSELRDSLESRMFSEGDLDDDALSIFYGSLDPDYRRTTGAASRSKWQTEADD